MHFEISNEDFGQLMFILANAEGKGITWSLVNPLMMKIGEQARIQTEAARHAQLMASTAPAPDIKVPAGNGSQEVRHE